MGGEREDVVAQKKMSTKGTETVGSVRFHESKGEVHFHDDANKLKAAVPSGVWYEAWLRLAGGDAKSFQYFDVKNATRLVVTVLETDGKVDALVAVNPASFTAEFQKLQQFTEGA